MAQNWFYQPGTVLNLNQAGSVMNPTLLLCDCLSPHLWNVFRCGQRWKCCIMALKQGQACAWAWAKSQPQWLQLWLGIGHGKRRDADCHVPPLGPAGSRDQVLSVPFKLLPVCTTNCTAHLYWSFWEHPQYKLL